MDKPRPPLPEKYQPKNEKPGSSFLTGRPRHENPHQDSQIDSYLKKHDQIAQEAFDMREKITTILLAANEYQHALALCNNRLKSLKESMVTGKREGRGGTGQLISSFFAQDRAPISLNAILANIKSTENHFAKLLAGQPDQVLQFTPQFANQTENPHFLSANDVTVLADKITAAGENINSLITNLNLRLADVQGQLRLRRESVRLNVLSNIDSET